MPIHPCSKLRTTISCILWLFSIAAFGQEKETINDFVRARIIDSQSKKPISFVRIINKSRHFGVYTDTLGVFTISAYHTDTLLISSISYFSMEISASDTLFKQTKIPQIALNERIYELGSVYINSLGTYQQFKYNVLHLQLPTNNTQALIESIQKELKLIPHHPLQAEASIPLGSPITALYMLFSKEGKSLRKYKKVTADEKERYEDERSLSIVNQKYNNEIVSQARLH